MTTFPSDFSQASPACVMEDHARRIFVDPAQFRRLLVSHRRLTRADERGSRLRGLLDLDTGEVFVTDERRLLEISR